MKRVDMACYRELVPYITKDPCGTVYPLSIAEMKQYGDVFTDGDSFLLWHFSGFAFIIGACGEDFLEQIYRDLLTADSLTRRFVLFTADERAERYFREKSELSFGRRYSFEYKGDTGALPAEVRHGYDVCELGEELFDTVEGRVTPRFSWRTSEEFLRNGKGICVLHGERAAAWAFSAAVSDFEMDIGVEALPEYRHMGLAFFAAEQMIRCCSEQGKRPVWSCDTGNTASRRLAEKLGFSVLSEYTTIKRQ